MKLLYRYYVNDIFNQSVVSLSGLYNGAAHQGAASPTAAVCLPASAGSAASALFSYMRDSRPAAARL